jgi:hypothetical protein
VSRIHALGGSILRISRANPTVRDEGAACHDRYGYLAQG